MKKTPLKRKGGRLFPQSPEDKAYWDWFKKQRYPCDVCGYQRAEAAHLTPRGSGGRDRSNLCYLCGDRIELTAEDTDREVVSSSAGTSVQGCHSRQEGRTDAFIMECKKPLWDIAQRHTRRFDNEGDNT